jgi:hypothetical protein
MANRSFDKARQLITLSPGLVQFYGGKSENAILMAQEILRTTFPDSYLSFLRSFGCGQIAWHELYGLVDENCQAEGVPSVVWVTREERRLGLPSTYVVVESSGDGALLCLDTAQLNDERECPLMYYIPDGFVKPQEIAQDFGEYFLECVHEALKDSNSEH